MKWRLKLVQQCGNVRFEISSSDGIAMTGHDERWSVFLNTLSNPGRKTVSILNSVFGKSLQKTEGATFIVTAVQTAKRIRDDPGYSGFSLNP